MSDRGHASRARYHHRMYDWTRFHAATLAGTLQGEIPRACERAWSWLDLAPEERRQRVAGTLSDEAAARWMLQALPFVRRRLWRDAGIDPDDTPRLNAFVQKLGTGAETPRDRELVRRFDATVDVGQTVAGLFPAAAAPAPAADPGRETLLAAVDQLTAAIHGKDTAVATPASQAALRQAIDAFAAIGAGLPSSLAREHAWWLGMAWWALGHGALDLARYDEGRRALTLAASHYEQGDDIAAAASCRERLRDLDVRLAADFDAAADRTLRALLVQRDPIGRAQALTQLAREAAGAGDKYEAARVAGQAAAVLRDARYPDPEEDFEAATQAWIDTAAETAARTALFARVCEVAQFWAVILGARASARLADDPHGGARAEATLRRLPAFSAELFEQARQAEDDAAQRFLAWCPPAGAPPVERPPVDAGAQRTEALAALDDGLTRLRESCNAAPDAAQLNEALRLRERAEALGSRVHAARAMVDEMYVLLALSRHAQVPALGELALRTLFGEHPRRLSSFTTGYERELYLFVIDYQARAYQAQGDDEAILALCEPVIRHIEGERAKVSSPYQQSAFLATRVELYELVAAAAFRLGRYDLVLAVSELLKARAALRSLLAPGADASVQDVDAQLADVNARLPDAAPEAAPALRERRQWLLDLRAIARTRAGGALPEVSLAAVRAALAADEAAVSWFWLGSGTLLVLAITRDGEHPTAIRLDPAQQGLLRDYASCVGESSAGDPDWDRLVPRIEELIAALGPVLFPADVAAFVKAKPRLVLSPHRTLHLFAFHAIAWPGGGFVGERFAVRYVPSLGSLLVPWRGNIDGRVLAVGVATFDDRALASLPDAEKEAAAVAAVHGARGAALLGATRAQFTAQPLADFRCIHLATHGSSVLAGSAVDDPLESALWFRDGPLTGWELMALALRAELVVLAACHSGQRSIAGRGLDRLPGDD
ncbi:MAG: CHAT domain-containing protein, partial [Burkholderiales bacterium]|nr:CHAT domain-containing protein [Burkholderiales bacterium]